MADIFDKCARFLRESPIIQGRDRAIAEGMLYRNAPLDNAGPWMEVEGRRILQFSTNDYLGMSVHPEVIEKWRALALDAVSAVLRQGTGRSSRESDLEKKLKSLERAFADLAIRHELVQRALDERPTRPGKSPR